MGAAAVRATRSGARSAPRTATTAPTGSVPGASSTCAAAGARARRASRTSARATARTRGARSGSSTVASPGNRRAVGPGAASCGRARPSRAWAAPGADEQRRARAPAASGGRRRPAARRARRRPAPRRRGDRRGRRVRAEHETADARPSAGRGADDRARDLGDCAPSHRHLPAQRLELLRPDARRPGRGRRPSESRRAAGGTRGSSAPSPGRRRRACRAARRSRC